MGLFTKSKITSDEYADCLNKIVKLNNEVLILTATVERMETRLKSFHTKLARTRRDEDEDEEQAVNSNPSPADIQRALMGMS